MPFVATVMDLQIVILSDLRQRKTNIWCHLYGESKDMIQMNWQNGNRFTVLENKLLVTRGEWAGVLGMGGGKDS